MSTIRFLAIADVVAQVDKFTPADVEVGDIFTLTATGLNGTTASVSFTATAATVANVTAGLTAAWNDSTNALHTPITAADNTTDLTLTADVPGVAFSVEASTTNGGAVDDQTLTRAVVTKNEGPNDYSSTDNWSGGALPGGAANQDVFIEGATILYGLDQSGIANTLDSLNISESRIGSNPASGCLAIYLQIKATAVNIGQHTGPGTPTELTPINIDVGATASTVTVYNTGTNSPATMPAVRIKTNHADTKVYVRKGKFGIGFEPGETSLLSEINESYVSQKTSDADVFIGPGVTLTTFNKTGGDATLECAATTVNNDGGDMITAGSGAIATINCSDGTVVSNSSGTVGACNSIGTGFVDFTKSAAPRTVTTPKIGDNGKIKYDPSITTMTNKIQPYDASGEITIQAA